jgi:multidrug efflux pump subunit AcrA (membrane-fusion protein)
VTVPKVAVRSAGGEGAEVVLCDGNVARIQAVEIGRRDEEWVEVTHGLKKGQHVAIDEVTGLEDGMAIDVRSESP